MKAPNDNSAKRLARLLRVSTPSGLFYTCFNTRRDVYVFQPPSGRTQHQLCLRSRANVQRSGIHEAQLLYAQSIHDLSLSPGHTKQIRTPVAVMEKAREEATESWTRSSFLHQPCHTLQERTHSSGCKMQSMHTTFSCLTEEHGVTLRRTSRRRCEKRHQIT